MVIPLSTVFKLGIWEIMLRVKEICPETERNRRGEHVRAEKDPEPKEVNQAGRYHPPRHQRDGGKPVCFRIPSEWRDAHSRHEYGKDPKQDGQRMPRESIQSTLFWLHSLPYPDGYQRIRANGRAEKTRIVSMVVIVGFLPD